MNVTVTLLLFQPAEFGVGDGDAEIVGCVCSRFTVAVAVALFPATSVAVPETVWLAPLVETVVGLGQVAMPDNESLHVKLTVTGVVFQPFALGAGERLAEIVGSVLSSLITTVAVAVAPAASVTVPDTGMLDPELEMVCGEGQLLIGAPPAVHTKLTVTLLLFQPAPLGWGDTLAVMVGAVSEMFSVMLALALFPARSVAVPLIT